MMLEKYLETIESETKNIVDNIDKDKMITAADLIKEAERNGNRVHVTGIGKPSYVAGYIASLLSSTGTPSYFLDGTEAVHGSSGQVRPGDVVIALSNSGETNELLATIKTLRNNKAKIISCTSKDSSSLSKAADVSLVAYVRAEGDDLNKPPRASILAEIIVLQALSIILQERNDLDSHSYLKWHPGGALGESIRSEKDGK